MPLFNLNSINNKTESSVRDLRLHRKKRKITFYKGNYDATSREICTPFREYTLDIQDFLDDDLLISIHASRDDKGVVIEFFDSITKEQIPAFFNSLEKNINISIHTCFSSKSSMANSQRSSVNGDELQASQCSIPSLPSLPPSLHPPISDDNGFETDYISP